MTISITPNGDGTFTISCGNESVTVGAAGGSPKDPAAPIPIFWPNNGGAAASIVAEGKAKIMVIKVPSKDDLLKAIVEQHRLHGQDAEPTIFQFDVEGPEALSVEEVNKTFSDLGNPDWMVTQIKLTGGLHE